MIDAISTASAPAVSSMSEPTASSSGEFRRHLAQAVAARRPAPERVRASLHDRPEGPETAPETDGRDKAPVAEGTDPADPADPTASPGTDPGPTDHEPAPSTGAATRPDASPRHVARRRPQASPAPGAVTVATTEPMAGALAGDAVAADPSTDADAIAPLVDTDPSGASDDAPVDAGAQAAVQGWNLCAPVLAAFAANGDAPSAAAASPAPVAATAPVAAGAALVADPAGAGVVGVAGAAPTDGVPPETAAVASPAVPVADPMATAAVRPVAVDPAVVPSGGSVAVDPANVGTDPASVPAPTSGGAAVAPPAPGVATRGPAADQPVVRTAPSGGGVNPAAPSVEGAGAAGSGGGATTADDDRDTKHGSSGDPSLGATPVPTGATEPGVRFDPRPVAATDTARAATLSTAPATPATSAGVLRSEHVRVLRELAPNREVQRLAVDLDGARVAVRFDNDGARVHVVADPGERLGGTWASDVQRTLSANLRQQNANEQRDPDGGRRRRTPYQQAAGDPAKDAEFADRLESAQGV